MIKKTSLTLILVLLLYSNGRGDERLPIQLIKLPPGFEIGLYAANVPFARSMTLAQRGLFVGTREAGKVCRRS
jgi:hypothetical protein